MYKELLSLILNNVPLNGPTNNCDYHRPSYCDCFLLSSMMERKNRSFHSSSAFISTSWACGFGSG